MPEDDSLAVGEVDRVRRACSETLVLSLLKHGPMHGYEMCRRIEERSAGYFTLKHSTLYPILHRLEKQGLVAGEWVAMDSGKPKKHYHLTAAGEAFYGETASSRRDFFRTLTLLVPEVAA